MRFPIVGSIYNSVKMAELKMKWQQHKDDPKKLKKEEENPQVTRLKEDMERIQEENKIAGMDNKLKAGFELTDEEMEYLKTNRPELYQEAVEIKKERKALEKISRRLMGIQNEHTKFTESETYEKLPAEKEVEDDK